MRNISRKPSWIRALIVTQLVKKNQTLVDQGLKCALFPGPSEGLSIKLVGGRIVDVTGDRVLMQTEVGKNWSKSDQYFFILDQDTEDLVVWYSGIIILLENPMIFLLKLWIFVQEGSLWKNRSILVLIWPLRTVYWEIPLMGCSLILIWKHGSHVNFILTFRNWIG